MKVGDKAYGFNFESLNNSANITYNETMDRFVEVQGTIIRIESDRFALRFDSTIQSVSNYWEYPINEYLAIQREDKLKELGI